MHHSDCWVQANEANTQASGHDAADEDAIGKIQWDNGPLVDDNNGVTGVDVQKSGYRI